MNRFTFRLVVALFTFIIGVTAASLWFVFRRPSGSSSGDTTRSTEVPAKQERTYRPGLGAGKCATKDGYPCSFTGFESSDGMSFSQMSEFYDSPRRATRALENKLK